VDSLNGETAVLITLVVAVLVIVLTAVFAEGTLDSASDFVTGGDEGEGIIECDPTEDGEACPEDTSTDGTGQTVEAGMEQWSL